MTKIQPKWFFAESYPSISSVSAEQWRTCATNWLAESLVVQNVQVNLLLRTIQKPLRRVVGDEKSPRTDDNVQGKLLHNHEQKFVNLADHLQLIKLCFNVGIAKTVARGQYFTTLDDAELDKLGGSCREYTLPRDYEASKVKGCIQSSSRPLPNRDREWNKQMRRGNDRGNPRVPDR